MINKYRKEEREGALEIPLGRKGVGELGEGGGRRKDAMDGWMAWMHGWRERTTEVVGCIAKGQEGREGKQRRKCCPLLCMDRQD